MHAIILSAGRGSRLLPLTTDLPKCLLPVGLSSVLALQIDTLLNQGIEKITIVTGFNSHLVEDEVLSRGYGDKVSTLYNPFYQVADNLASCWMARQEMNNNFLLINGDTLFSPELLTKVLAAPARNISVTIDQKEHYDGDDMKVSLSGYQLTAIGKTLLPQQTQGESIGMLRFMKNGPSIFKNELERLMRMEEGTKSWFLSAINGLALSGKVVDTTNIKGEKWAELDTPEDYEICLDLFGGSQMQRKRIAAIK